MRFESLWKEGISAPPSPAPESMTLSAVMVKSEVDAWAERFSPVVTRKTKDKMIPTIFFMLPKLSMVWKTDYEQYLKALLPFD